MVGNKPMYILDACVILKWFFYQNEQDVDAALLLRDRFIAGEVDCLIPTHCFYEVMNVSAIRAPQETLWLCSQLFVMQIQQYDLDLSITSKSCEILRKIAGVIFYDAVYHALAMKLGGTFVTADEKYFRKTKHLKQVMLLKDYK